MAIRGEHWRDSVPLLIACLLIFGPLAIPLIWLNRKIKPAVKIASTILILGLSIASYQMMVGLTEKLQEQSGSESISSAFQI